jgi:ligand-binding sensor domain-containing protein
LAETKTGIISIFEDSKSRLWFGTRDNGAWRFNGHALTNFTTGDRLPSNTAWTIYRDRKNDLWFGKSDGCVCRFNGESFDSQFFSRQYLPRSKTIQINQIRMRPSNTTIATSEKSN